MTDQTLLALLRQDPERGMAALVDHYGTLAAAIAGRVLPGRGGAGDRWGMIS